MLAAFSAAFAYFWRSLPAGFRPLKARIPYYFFRPSGSFVSIANITTASPTMSAPEIQEVAPPPTFACVSSAPIGPPQQPMPPIGSIPW